MTLKRDTSLDEAVEREVKIVRERYRRAEVIDRLKVSGSVVQRRLESVGNCPAFEPLPSAVFEALGGSPPTDGGRWLFPDDCQIELASTSRGATWGYHIADEELIRAGVMMVRNGTAKSARDASLKLAARAAGGGTEESRATRLALEIKARLKT